MPLVKSASNKARQENIHREISAGKKPSQAVAIGAAEHPIGAAEHPYWQGRGIHVPPGMTRAEIIAIADIILDSTDLDRYTACFLAKEILAINLRSKPI